MIRILASAVVCTALLASSPSLADPPPWAGKGKGHSDKGKGKGKGHDRADSGPRVVHFGNEHRTIVHEYYDASFRSGKCPPGLAKKNNGCMPPGQAKKWRMGRPLPRDVVYYTVPQPLVVQLGAPPAGHRYVRVGADILMITVGTALVVDAIQDLGRM